MWPENQAYSTTKLYDCSVWGFTAINYMNAMMEKDTGSRGAT